MRKTVSIAAAVTTLAASLVAGTGPSQAAAPTCFGRTATIVGTPGNDDLHGSPGTDVIYGGGGDDYIVGWSTANGNSEPDGTAPEYICGGPGKDTIYGNAGNDHINGGDGNDPTLNGGPGSDVIQGGAGTDYMEAEYDPGDGAANDVMHGNGGNDTLRSDYGPDKLYGDGGSDILMDGDCFTKDRLYGGAGSDTLKSYQWYYGGYSCEELGNSVPDYLNGGTESDHSINDRIDTLVSVEDPTIVS